MREISLLCKYKTDYDKAFSFSLFLFFVLCVNFLYLFLFVFCFGYFLYSLLFVFVFLMSSFIVLFIFYSFFLCVFFWFFFYLSLCVTTHSPTHGGLYISLHVKCQYIFMVGEIRRRYQPAEKGSLQNYVSKASKVCRP